MHLNLMMQNISRFRLTRPHVRPHTCEAEGADVKVLSNFGNSCFELKK